MKTSLLFIYILILVGSEAFAQDIEPRRWTPFPLNSSYIGAGYGYTNGTIFFDPVLKIEDVTVNVSTFAVSYIHPFKLGKKLARFDVMLPYSIANWDGLLSGTPTSVNRSGFADPRLRFSVNILGPEAMELKEMQEYISTHPVFTVLGVSLAVTLPLGQYYEEKLLNLGQNRFVFRPQAGFVHNWRKWSYELTASVYIYGNNNDFFNDQTRKQDPVFAMQTHLIHRFNHGIWGSLSFGSGLAGQSVVNNLPNNDEREDILGGLSLGFPVVKKQALKLVYYRSQTLNDVGGDTNSFGVVWSASF